MTLHEKIGQMIVQEVYGREADTADDRNVERYGVGRPAEVVAKYHLGGVIYFPRTDNIHSPRQIATLSNGLQKAATSCGAGVPLQIGIDQEHGPVIRLGPPVTQLPSAMGIGATRSIDDAREASRITGSELAALGINVNFAPVADVNVNPANPVIGVRSFSSDPQLAASMVTAHVGGFQSEAKISSTVKHFPGHGDTSVDSHTGLPVIGHSREEWEKIDAPPFRAAIAADVDQVMTAHIVVPALDSSGDPATLSKTILTGKLREDLGFGGVIVTDSLAMEGVRTKYGDGEVAVRAIEAGADQLVMPPKMDIAVEAIVSAVQSGRISTARLDESVTRILRLKAKRGLFDRSQVDPDAVDGIVGTPASLAAAAAMADRSVTLLKNTGDTLPIARGRKVFVTGTGNDATAAMADELTHRGSMATRLFTGPAPTPEQIMEASTAAAAADVTIVMTANASLPAGASQRDLVKALHATGKPVIVVATRMPYDIKDLPDTKVYLATYASDTVSARAAARIITGAVRPRGKLPVSIPRADGSGDLYPFGVGITLESTTKQKVTRR